MVDSVQTVLILVIVILTFLLVVLGIQVFFILKDLRKTLTKANRVLDNANAITENVSGPLSSLSTVLTTVKSGSVITVAKIIKGFLSKDETDEEQKRRKE
jgi:hypothetical protein